MHSNHIWIKLANNLTHDEYQLATSEISVALKNMTYLSTTYLVRVTSVTDITYKEGLLLVQASKVIEFFRDNEKHSTT